ncbi:response regulator transcription factor [Oceanobacillus halotolerans]|uniref:response regulator transcription factor n=1 Tax=Oceanobacillus halotolerans TaxID=2663380 RepID=UPI0013D9DD1D|nr:response regulator transcription factor [Oceanobacillus halotolerans]
MTNITIIQESDLLRDRIIKALVDKLDDTIIRGIGTKKNDITFNENDNTDLMIVDIDANVDIDRIVNHCLEHDIKIAIWTTNIHKDQLVNLFKQGLHGYFYNGMEMSELVFAIKTMLNGEQYIHPHLSSVLLNEYINVTSIEPTKPNGVLSGREWEVLEQICQGNSNSTIAKNLFISCKTVNNHMISIFRKLHVPDRTNAALKAVKNNWISL